VDKRHPIQPGISPGGRVEVRGLIQRRGSSEYAPISQQKVCRVILEVNDMDITLMAYGDLADTLAGFAAASPLTVKGDLHFAQWTTGDGTLHRRIGVRVEEIDHEDA